VAAAEPTTGGAMDHKDRSACRITDRLEGQRASIAYLDSLRAHPASSPQFLTRPDYPGRRQHPAARETSRADAAAGADSSSSHALAQNRDRIAGQARRPAQRDPASEGARVSPREELGAS